jgi:LPS-assembly lipoprotein
MTDRRACLRLLGGLLGGGPLLALSGCGFRLRGTLDVPSELTPLFIQAPAASPVRQSLEEQFSGGPVALAASAAKAKLILRILSEQRTSRVVATDIAGKVLAFELHYLVRFDAVAAGGTQKIPPETLDLVRTFDNPDVEVLGKQLEEEQIFQEFAIDAADRILMRLRAALR